MARIPAHCRKIPGFEPLLPVTVKGKTQPVMVYRPAGEGPRALPIDRLAPAEQLTPNTASVIGRSLRCRS
jgi:hypothetical protein